MVFVIKFLGTNEWMKMESILIKDLEAIVTQDRNRRIIRGADILIEGKYISRVGRDLPSNADKVIDSQGMIAIPGLVNMHTHIPMSLLRGIADDMELMEWLNTKIWPIEANLDPETVKYGALLGMLEAIRTGTTMLADMYFFEDEIARAAIEIGMRAILASSYMDFGTPQARDREKAFKIAKDFVKEWKNKEELVIPSLGPHAPYTCSPDLLQESMDFAIENDCPIQIHLAEDYSEVEEIKKKYGKTPVKHVADLGLFKARVIAAHVIWPNEEEIPLLANRNVLVSHNPISNLKVAAGISPVPEMISKGVSVGLGTDGPASNNTVDMFETMKLAALIHKLAKKDPTIMKAQQVLDMATIIPAESLGLNIGSIEEGKLADIVLLKTNLPWWTPLHSVVSHLIYAARSTDVNIVIINGKIVLRNGKLKTLDEEGIMERATNLSKSLLEKSDVSSEIMD
ncbi:MAG TPA: amidohydrolase [Candidatus Korarchaeota archaeon]|nr:amidohydrolase [Candidatus Korarchaeota archaeon]